MKKKAIVAAILIVIAAVVIYQFTLTTNQTGEGTYSQKISAIESNAFHLALENKNRWKVIQTAQVKGSVFERDEGTTQYFALEEGDASAYQQESNYWEKLEAESSEKAHPFLLNHENRSTSHPSAVSSWWHPETEGPLTHMFDQTSTNGMIYLLDQFLFTNNAKTYRLTKLFCHRSDYNHN